MTVRTGLAVAASACALVLVGCAAPWNSVEFNPGPGGRFAAVSHDGFLGHAYYSAELSREIEILRGEAVTAMSPLVSLGAQVFEPEAQARWLGPARTIMCTERPGGSIIA